MRPVGIAALFAAPVAAVIAGVVACYGPRRALGAVEPMPGGGTIVTGRDIPHFRLLALKYLLHLETLGLKHHGPFVYATIKREFGLRGDKKSVLAQFTALVEAAKAARAKGMM
jgi:hypothetical protein